MLRFQIVSDRGSSWFCGGTGTANPSTGKVKENTAANIFQKVWSKHILNIISNHVSNN